MDDLGGWSRRRMDEASSTHGRSLVDAWTEPRRRMDEFGPSGGVTFVAEPSAFSERGKLLKFVNFNN